MSKTFKRAITYVWGKATRVTKYEKMLDVKVSQIPALKDVDTAVVRCVVYLHHDGDVTADEPSSLITGEMSTPLKRMTNSVRLCFSKKGIRKSPQSMSMKTARSPSQKRNTMTARGVPVEVENHLVIDLL